MSFKTHEAAEGHRARLPFLLVCELVTVSLSSGVVARFELKHSRQFSVLCPYILSLKRVSCIPFGNAMWSLEYKMCSFYPPLQLMSVAEATKQRHEAKFLITTSI